MKKMKEAKDEANVSNWSQWGEVHLWSSEEIGRLALVHENFDTERSSMLFCSTDSSIKRFDARYQLQIQTYSNDGRHIVLGIRILVDRLSFFFFHVCQLRPLSVPVSSAGGARENERNALPQMNELRKDFPSRRLIRRRNLLVDWPIFSVKKVGAVSVLVGTPIVVFYGFVVPQQ